MIVKKTVCCLECGSEQETSIEVGIHEFPEKEIREFANILRQENPDWFE
jgi:hypothetical protein